MKKLGYLFLAALVSAGMSACGDDEKTGGGEEPAPKLTLTVSVSDITAYAAKMNITASDATSIYYAGYMTEAEYTKNGGNAAGIATYVEALIKKEAQERGKTVAEVVALKSIKGNKVIELNDITPSTKYVTYAMAWNTEAKAVNTPVVKPFETAAPPAGMKISLADGSSLIYNGYFNAPGVKINAFTYVYNDGASVNQVPVAVAYEGSACTLTYDYQGEGMKMVYQLNADGYPTEGTLSYSSDNAIARHYSFTYEGKLLTKVVEDKDPEGAGISTYFEATYSGSDYATVASDMLGGELKATAGTVANNYGVDPNVFFISMGDNPLMNGYVLANCCGLLPHAAKFPVSFAMAGEDEEGNPMDIVLPVDVTVENGKLASYSIVSEDVGIEFNVAYTYSGAE